MRNLMIAGSIVALALPMSGALADGKATYETACGVCHAEGVAGAPKVGDAAAWKDRIAQGMDTLNQHAIEGFQGKAGVMPAKGGFANLSDDEVKAAVTYMLDNSK